MNRRLMLDQIKTHYKFKSDTEFAQHLGITPQNLSNWKSRNTFDAQLIYTKCEDVDPEWLLTGKGEMLKTVKKEEPPEEEASEKEVPELQKKIIDLQNFQIEQLKKEIDRLKKELASAYRAITTTKTDR